MYYSAARCVHSVGEPRIQHRGNLPWRQHEAVLSVRTTEDAHATLHSWLQYTTAVKIMRVDAPWAASRAPHDLQLARYMPLTSLPTVARRMIAPIVSDLVS